MEFREEGATWGELRVEWQDESSPSVACIHENEEQSCASGERFLLLYYIAEVYTSRNYSEVMESFS
jgi:hypothetical protein